MFYMSSIFTVDVQYADDTELQAPAKISTYTLKIVAFVLAHLFFYLLEEEEVEIPIMKECGTETEEAPNDSAPTTNESAPDVNTQDAKEVENGVPKSKDKPSLMETDAKVEVRKKKVKM